MRQIYNSAKKFVGSTEPTSTSFKEKLRFATESTGPLPQKATDSHAAEAF